MQGKLIKRGWPGEICRLSNDAGMAKRIPKVLNVTQKLDEIDLNPISKSCLFCGDENRMAVGRLQSGPPIDLLRCLSCEIVSASRIPTSEYLDRYYKEYYDKPFLSDKKEKVAIGIPRCLAHHLFKRQKNNLLHRDLDLLDFGGGDGSVAVYLTEYLQIDSANITVVDHQPNVVFKSPPPHVRVDKFEKLQLVEKRHFDFVIGSAVLEHIPNPRETLRELLLRLRPGGVLYARTPYILPLWRFARMFGVKIDFTYPAHLHDMGARFWNRVLNTMMLEMDYEVIESQTSLVETAFRDRPLLTTVAHLLKAPSTYLFGANWPFVGGWEVFIKRKSS
jgi:2-polyprenyl-3-methyl-5-hydroxy-6-metoxy-1,4-benzoquinol methylase